MTKAEELLTQENLNNAIALAEKIMDLLDQEHPGYIDLGLALGFVYAEVYEQMPKGMQNENGRAILFGILQAAFDYAVER